MISNTVHRGAAVDIHTYIHTQGKQGKQGKHGETRSDCDLAEIGLLL